MTAESTARRFALASPATATVLGALVVVLAAALVPLAALVHHDLLLDGGEAIIAVPFAPVGFIVARRQPGNPIGWLLLAVPVCLLLSTDSGFYAALIYRQGYHLPLGPAALLLYQAWFPALASIVMVIYLFPDGRLPRGFWRWTVRAFSAVLVGFMIVLTVAAADVIVEHRIRLDVFNGLAAIDDPVGWLAVAQDGFAFFGLAVIVLLAIRQTLNWRRSSGERRQQLKWLVTGTVVTALSLILSLLASGSTTPAVAAVSNALFVGVAALPVSVGVAILKYRLYDIDKIISRTLAYAIVTGLLVGVYTGLVLLATQALPVALSTPVAVAGSTLVAAALFNPLRRRVQRVVDRRFNRARYDADVTVAAFAARLQDAVDLDSVRDDLASVVQQALEPVHVSVWMTERR